MLEIFRQRRQFIVLNGREPTLDELAALCEKTPDAVEQLLPVRAATAVFQTLVIKSKALSQVLLEHTSCPLSKCDGATRADSVSNAYDRIEVIEFYRSANHSLTLLLNYRGILGS